MAKERDIHVIISLMQPYVDQGSILQRTYDDIERQMENWVVVERDGNVIACSSLDMFENNTAELAGVAVTTKSKHTGIGDAMLGFQMRRAYSMGITKLFALSTVTMDWFQERGFVPGNISDLPPSKRLNYDKHRKSKIMIKSLNDKRLIDEQELFLDII